MTIFLCYLCLFLLCLVPLIYFEIFKPLKLKLPPRPGNPPPGPTELPMSGIFNGTFQLHRRLRDLSQNYGPVMLIPFGFGSFSVVVISSKEAAEEDLEGCSRPETVGSRIFSYHFKESRFAPDGEDWETSRDLALLELFKTKTHFFRYIREEENDLLVNKISESASTRSPVNLTRTLFTSVSSTVCRVIFGERIQECKSIDEDSIAGIVHKFDLIIELSSFSDSSFLRGFRWLIDLFFGLSKRSKKAYSELDAFFQNVLDDHLKPGRIVSENNPDVLDLIIDMMKRHEKDGDSFKLATDYLKGIITDTFLAEVNTSVIALVWAMTELVRNPRVMKKVQDEIRTTLGDKKERIREDDLNELRYLKLVVKETFRLHPPVPFFPPPETLSRVKIQGYDIPEEAMIMVNVYAIARDPKLWTNPDEFNPDRFLDSSTDFTGLDFELLPLGSGKVICPEMRIATVELGLLNLLYFFDWGLPQGKTLEDLNMDETGFITLSKKAALELVPVFHH